jgi:hypothetical protein
LTICSNSGEGRVRPPLFFLLRSIPPWTIFMFDKNILQLTHCSFEVTCFCMNPAM